MATAFPTRLFLVFAKQDDLMSAYRDRQTAKIKSWIVDELKLKPPANHFEIVSRPSLAFTLKLADPDARPTPMEVRELVVGVQFAQLDAVKAFLDAARSVPSESPLTSLGADPPLYALDHWCPGYSPAETFNSRAQARQLIGADRLPVVAPGGVPVNVVVVDQGFDGMAIPAANYGGGFSVDMSDFGLPVRQPGTGKTLGHGAMVVRSIRDLAPTARLFDLPLIPDEIDDPGMFLDFAYVAFRRLRRVIQDLKLDDPDYRGPWLVVNAWGVLDRRWEDLLGANDRYSDNPAHPFNRVVRRIVRDGNDVIFAAGNCGQFCPSRRCGPRDIGPSNSILGANALAEVITTGAVRTDTMWIGSSSQGPGLIAAEKPDICAPSFFAEERDAHLLSTGTSAACAVTAGVVAALRRRWNSDQVSPSAMARALRDSARQIGVRGYHRRYGYGVLDVPATVRSLTELYP